MSCKKEIDQASRGLKEADIKLESVREQYNQIPAYELLEVQVSDAMEIVSTIESGTARADRVLELNDRLAEVRSRAVVDVGPLLASLDVCSESLDRCQMVERLADALPQARLKVEAFDTAAGEDKATLLNLEYEYEVACKKAGVCKDCGGLLTHEECAV